MSDHGGAVNGKSSEMSLTCSREKRWKFPIDENLAARREVTVLNFFNSQYCGTLPIDSSFDRRSHFNQSYLEKNVDPNILLDILNKVRAENQFVLNPVNSFWSAYTTSFLKIIDHNKISNEENFLSYEEGMKKFQALENWIFTKRLENWVWEQLRSLYIQGHLQIQNMYVSTAFLNAGLDELNGIKFNKNLISTDTTIFDHIMKVYDDEKDEKKKMFVKRCLIKAVFLQHKKIRQPYETANRIQAWVFKALASMDNVVINVLTIRDSRITYTTKFGKEEPNKTYLQEYFDDQFEPIDTEVLLSYSSEDYFQPTGLRDYLVLGNINGDWKTITWKDFLWLAVINSQNADERLPAWINRLMEMARTSPPDWKKGLAVLQTPTSNTLICLLKTMLEKSRKKSIKFNRSIIDQHSKDLYFDYVIESAKRVWYAVAVKFCNCLELDPKKVTAKSTWNIEWKGKHVPARPRLDNLIVDFVPNDLSGKPRQRITDDHWTKFVRALYSQNISYFIAEFQKEMLKKMDWEDRGENWGSEVRSNGLFCFWFNEQDVFRCLDYLERQKNPQIDDGIPGFEPEIENDGNTEQRRVTALVNPEVAEAATDDTELDDKSDTGSSNQSQGTTAVHDKSDVSSNATHDTDQVNKRKAPLPDILDCETKKFSRSFERFCRMMDAEVKKIGGKSSYSARDRDAREEYMRRGACTWWRLIHAYSSQDAEATELQIKDSAEKLEQARVTVGYLEGDWDDKAQKINFKGISGIRKAMADWREWRSRTLDDGKRWKYMAYGSVMSAPGVTAVETSEDTRNAHGARENEYLVGRRGGV
jgi:hypothetical protein